MVMVNRNRSCVAFAPTPRGLGLSLGRTGVTITMPMADGHRICPVDHGTVQAGSHTMPPYGAYRAVACCLCLCLSLSLYGSGMAITLIPLGP